MGGGGISTQLRQPRAVVAVLVVEESSLLFAVRPVQLTDIECHCSGMVLRSTRKVCTSKCRIPYQNTNRTTLRRLLAEYWGVAYASCWRRWDDSSGPQSAIQLRFL